MTFSGVSLLWNDCIYGPYTLTEGAPGVARSCGCTHPKAKQTLHYQWLQGVSNYSVATDAPKGRL